MHNNIDLDLSSLRHQSSRHAQHIMHRTNRTHTTNSKATVAETEDDNASLTIEGTIPMHGKGLKMCGGVAAISPLFINNNNHIHRPIDLRTYRS